MQQRSNGSDLNQQTQQHYHHPHQQQWGPNAQHQHHHQQQWMAAMQYPAAAMQYPAAAMAMMQQQQQMMMYPSQHQHHYMAYYQQQQQQWYQKQQQQQQYQKQLLGSIEESKTIWVGDLLHWMDETYLHSCFSHTGEVSSVKIIRNKHTGQPEGYGFVEFNSHATAEKVLQNYSGTVMPNTDQPFHLNWASFSGDRQRSDASSDLSIFVGDLPADVTDTVLQETFAGKYPSVKGAKVVTDSNTGRSKGYGFVRFGDENERSRAMVEMNGVYCYGRPMRVGVATPKRSSAYQQQYSSQALVLAGGHPSNGFIAQGSHSDGDSNNTTIYVGGIESAVSDEDLRLPFSQFGEVLSVKIPLGKGCGFVQFADRKSAEDALQSLNGTVIGEQTVRLSWGRSPANKQWRGERSNQWNGAYYGGQDYSASGYAMMRNQAPGGMYVVPATAASGAS